MVGWVRNALALFGSLVAASAVIALAQAVGHRLTGAAATPPYPESMFLVPILSYALGMAVAAWILGRFAAGRARTLAALAAVILFALAVANTLSFAHPWWFLPAAAAALSLGWLVTGLKRDVAA